MLVMVYEVYYLLFFLNLAVCIYIIIHIEVCSYLKNLMTLIKKKQKISRQIKKVSLYW